jgi:hypothetical protein
MRAKRSQSMEINAQRTQNLETAVQMNEIIEVNSIGSGIRNEHNGGDDGGSVNEDIEDKNEDLMMDLLINEAREEMEQDEAEVEGEVIAANQRPQWERGSSVLAERQAPMDAHEGGASQSLRFIQNADGKRIVAAVQRPGPAGPQSPMHWELVLSGATEAGNSDNSAGEMRSNARPAARNRGELKTSSSVYTQLSQRQQVNQRKAMRKESEVRELREMNIFLDEIDEEIDEATPEGTKKKYRPIQDDFEVHLYLFSINMNPNMLTLVVGLLS